MITREEASCILGLSVHRVSQFAEPALLTPLKHPRTRGVRYRRAEVETLRRDRATWLKIHRDSKGLAHAMSRARRKRTPPAVGDPTADLITRGQAAEILGLSVYRLRQLEEPALLTPLKHPDAVGVRYSRAEVEALERARAQDQFVPKVGVTNL